MRDPQRVSNAIELMSQAMRGCSDGNCAVRGKTLGMHTNGGCQCVRNIGETALMLAVACHDNYRYPGALPPPQKEEIKYGMKPDDREHPLWNLMDELPRG